ncbi:hypothetical protein [Nocardioides speluncae]|uniref:hypothetical protein n=1 Tax=Nocardioides speluncae TaxID=2670337 RepID=UPI000D69C544|nr:hypothetical protein [Nocardioides speluncae]
MPRLLARVGEVAHFEQAAADGGGSFVEVLVVDDRGEGVERFYRRDGDDPWHDTVKQFVASAGGPAMLAGFEGRLRTVVAERPLIRTLVSREGDVDATYAALLDLLGEAAR